MYRYYDEIDFEKTDRRAMKSSVCYNKLCNIYIYIYYNLKNWSSRYRLDKKDSSFSSVKIRKISVNENWSKIDTSMNSFIEFYTNFCIHDVGLNSDNKFWSVQQDKHFVFVIVASIINNK